MLRPSCARLFLQLLLGCCLAARASAGACTPAVTLTILSYHEIAERGDALIPQYAVTPANFAAQMQWLRASGHHFVGISDVLASESGKHPLPPDAVLVTFDDGYRSVYTQAFPVLKAMRIPSVVALVGSWLEVEDGDVDFDGRPIPRSELLSWDDIRAMQRSGLVEVASHSHALHRGIPGNPQGNLEPAATTRQWLGTHYEGEASYQRRVSEDLRRNNRLLEAKLGRSPRVIVWPYGRYNIETTRIAKSLGMPIGLTLDDGPNTAATPRKKRYNNEENHCQDNNGSYRRLTTFFCIWVRFVFARSRLNDSVHGIIESPVIVILFKIRNHSLINDLLG
jgi:biofilm PGA synthesis lipoprotein PgaB